MGIIIPTEKNKEQVMPLNINGNTGKVLRWSALIIFALGMIIAQSASAGKRESKIENNIDRLDRHAVSIVKTQEEIKQIGLDVNSIQDDVGNTADDVKEMKADLKEFIRVQQTLNNKFMEHILTDNN